MCVCGVARDAGKAECMACVMQYPIFFYLFSFIHNTDLFFFLLLLFIGPVRHKRIVWIWMQFGWMQTQRSASKHCLRSAIRCFIPTVIINITFIRKCLYAFMSFIVGCCYSWSWCLRHSNRPLPVAHTESWFCTPNAFFNYFLKPRILL